MVKINKKEKSQSRNFLLTSKRFLNVGKKVKRSIELSNLAGISLSLESYEFVIHVQNDYDYRLISEEFRDQVLFYIVATFCKVLEGESFLLVNQSKYLFFKNNRQ